MAARSGVAPLNSGGMRIGIDCRQIYDPERGERAGVGRYVERLASALAATKGNDEFILFFGSADAKDAFFLRLPSSSRAECRVLPPTWMPMYGAHVRVAAAIDAARLDLFHGTANHLPLTLRTPSILTLHDLAAYHHPEWFPNRPIRAAISKKILVPMSVAKARRVIAVSDATKTESMRLLGVPGEKIDVIHEGVGTFVAPPDADAKIAFFGLRPKKFVLFVGTIEPRKNLPVAADAFIRAARSLPSDVVFAVAGGRGWRCEESEAALREAELRVGKGRVRMLGYVSDSDRHALLSGAAAFFFPSRYEGFGLPVLEAMSAGVPVVSSNAGALPEVIGDAAFMADVDDAAAMAAELVRIFSIEAHADSLGRAGRARAATFTWEEAARKTLVSYRKAVSPLT